MIAPNENVPPVCPQCGADLLVIKESRRLVCSRSWDHYPLGLEMEKEQRELVPVLEQGGLPPTRTSPVAAEWKRFERRNFPDANAYIGHKSEDQLLCALLSRAEALHRKWAKANDRNWTTTRRDGIRESRWTGGPIGRDVSPPPPRDFDELDILYVDYVDFMRIRAPGAPVRTPDVWRADYLRAQAARVLTA